CRDGFCPIARMVPASAGFDIDSASLSVHINGQLVSERSLQQLVRPAAQLLADVTEFMTLVPGDVLLLGPGEGAPLARAADTVVIAAPGLGELRHTLVEEQLQGAQA